MTDITPEDVGLTYQHPGYGKPYPMATVLRDLASQEGCDGEPYDAMVAAADMLEALSARLADVEARANLAERYLAEKRKHLVASEALGGWMSAALEDPKVCAEMKADINAWFAALEPMEPKDE